MTQLVELHKDDAALVRRAMRNLHNREPVDRPKWVVVMHTFELGSTEAAKLCRRMGMNPEAVMSGAGINIGGGEPTIHPEFWDFLE